MKYIILIITFLGLTFVANSQNASVEKSTYGIQSGILGLWAHNEVRLSNKIALRTEIGVDVSLWGGNFYTTNAYIVTPVIAIEPRWYYNLDKRLSNLKNISGNSGNFLTIKMSYHPNLFVISNYDSDMIDQVSFIPTWGLKRNLGKHFTYETGIGLGYRYIFYKSIDNLENNGEVAWNIHLRMGYRF